jgi:hypothetical protein
MSNKNDGAGTITEEAKELGQKHTLSKFEHDLYDEKEDIRMPVIRVKRICTSNNIERWKIMSDNKAVLVIEGSKLNKKERNFLRTLEGFNFLISEHKLGINSFAAIKKSIKKYLADA